MSVVLHKLVSVFMDERDQRGMAVTPIYLLLGCALPVWWMRDYSKDSIFLAFSGIASVGIGDGFAAVVGSSVGRHRWPGTRKTFYGSFAMWMMMIWGYYMFELLLQIELSLNFRLALGVATTLSLLWEAYTTPTDNLSLPVFFYSALALTVGLIA